MAGDPPNSNPITSNPITRARLSVEAEVPPSRRGPGWDRHWRELEAYFDAQGEWSVPPVRGDAEDDGADAD
jgi:hypothetical protein